MLFMVTVSSTTYIFLPEPRHIFHVARREFTPLNKQSFYPKQQHSHQKQPNR